MQTYILILIGILVLLLIGVVYFGWRKIINLEIESNKNKYDIEALRGLLSKLLDGDEIEMNPSFFKKERPYNIQMNANELKNAQVGGADEEESEVETLHSSDDEEEIPEDESTVSIENIEDEDSDSDEDDSDEDEDEDDSDEDEDEDDSEDESEEEETENSEKDDEVKRDVSETEVKEINLEKTEYTQEIQENVLEEEAKTEVKVIEVANKNVKKFPSESLKNYKAGDVVVSKNDGNKYKVVMYKNQKKWKHIDE